MAELTASVPAGVIKIAGQCHRLGAYEERVLEAAAAAAAATGAPICVHTEMGTHGDAILERLSALGVAPARVVLGHLNRSLKAYLIRERGRDGSPVNQYAPFYLWADTDGMGRFLPGVDCSALAVDPRHWQLVHFTLWRDSSPPMAGTRYQVLHLSRGSAP